MKILVTGGNGNLATILKTSLKSEHIIDAPSRKEMNLLDLEHVKTYFADKEYDVVIHTAIQGGRRTRPDTYEDVYNNLLMFENLMLFKDNFKMFLNLDSGATCDRATDIYMRKEDDMPSVPKDFYGFSKYMIHQRGLSHDNFYNLRIFNIFHETEEPDRFISRCVNVAKEGGKVEIFENKYFDFFYKDDFVEVAKYYIRQLEHFKNSLSTMKYHVPKTLNLSYMEKHTLADIAKMVLGEDSDKIVVHKDECDKNYCGDGTLLLKLNIEFKGLEYGIHKLV
jgi:nucleoside-diphosphate-sugar epimerase